MPEMEIERFEVDGQKFSIQEVREMTEEELTSLYNSITAGPENKLALSVVSGVLIDRKIF